MDGMGLKGDIMYEWVTDKKFIKETYSICADIVNQLVQRLNKEGINSYFFDVGSKRRNMITRNGKAPIDFDFNLFIENGMRYNCKELKEYIMNIFNEILKIRNGERQKIQHLLLQLGQRTLGRFHTVLMCALLHLMVGGITKDLFMRNMRITDTINIIGISLQVIKELMKKRSF